MIRQFNSDHRQQLFPLQMQAAKLETFMERRKHDLLSDSFDGLVAEINRIVPQLSDRLNTEILKLNFQREAVINHRWPSIAVLQSQAQKLTFLMIVDSLNS